MGHPQPPGNEGRIELANSELSVHDGQLVKKDIQRQTVIARHDLADLRSATLMKRIDPAGLWFMGVLASSAYLCWRFMPATWGKVAGGILLLLAFLCLLGIHKKTLRVEGPDGRADYDLVDADTACEGFVLSLRARIREARGDV